MILITDSREQKELRFSHPYITAVRKEKLDVADYACIYKNGHVCQYVFERKSMGDLFGSLSGGYPRFKKEIDRAKENNQILYILIEGSFTKIMKGYSRSKIKGISIARTLWTLRFRYGIHHKYCTTRREMAEFITQFYCWYGSKKLYLEKEN